MWSYDPAFEKDGLLLWIPILILTGIVYCFKVVARKLGYGYKGDSLGTAWRIILMLTAFAFAAGFLFLMAYITLVDFPKAIGNLLNGEFENMKFDDWVGLLIGFLITVSLVAWLGNILLLALRKIGLISSTQYDRIIRGQGKFLNKFKDEQ